MKKTAIAALTAATALAGACQHDMSLEEVKPYSPTRADSTAAVDSTQQNDGMTLVLTADTTWQTYFKGTF